jgi:hypothetical protein
MVMTIKERMELKKKAEQQATTGGLKSRLGINRPSLGKSSVAGGSSLRNKFKKRNASVLDKTYEDRNEKSKSSQMGKTIFNQELMAEYGIEDFTTTMGDHFVEVLPISFDSEVAYFLEIPVHFSVGFANDAFICMHRYKGSRTRRCYRCEKQAIMWRDQVKYTKDETVKLFPTDRTCYLLWERTKELIEGESPDYTFKLWAAPKTKVHSEIQEKVRDKITRRTLDISDISIGGEGRTVGFTINKQGDFPDYKAFDLIQRDNPIPDEVLEKLDMIIRAAEEQGYHNCIEMFLNLPTYEEVKESMETEEIKDDISTNPQASPSTNRRSILRGQTTSTPAVSDKNPLAAAEEGIMQELERLQAELEVISKNPIKWRQWCVDNEYEVALEMDIVEAIPAIIDDMYEKAIADLTGDSH